MTWLKMDDHFHLNDKVAPLSDRAWRLHVTAKLECARKLTNGNIGRKIPSTLVGAPRGRALGPTIKELEDAGLWEPVGNWGWQIHDFLDWNPHSTAVLALREKRRQAGRLGGSRQAKRQANDKQTQKQIPKQNDSKPPSKSQPRTRTSSLREEDPPLPPSETPDRFGASFRTMRADVLELHAAWRETFGFENHQLRSVSDHNYEHLAEAIDADGLDNCRGMLTVAKRDSWVNGKADKGNKHEQIRYVFGNPDTRARLLRSFKAKSRPSGKLSPADAVELARTAEPDGEPF